MLVVRIDGGIAQVLKILLKVMVVVCNELAIVGERDKNQSPQ